MTTTEMYRLPAFSGASTAMLGHNVRLRFWSRDDVLVASGSTDEMLAHARAMRELAALSFDPNSLDRDLEDEINRNAWGISEA